MSQALTQIANPCSRDGSLCSNRGKRAFTLLELLVVVAIISLLVAILIPALGRARQQAKKMKCQTNLHSIASAWHQYLIEFEGRFLKSRSGRDNEQINYGGKQGAIELFQGPKPLNRFLGGALDIPEMLAVIDPALYRQRKES